MDVNIPDFTGLSLTAIVTLTILVGLLDTAYAVLQAVIQKVFSAAYVADFLESHASRIWFPITALAIIGHGISGLGVPVIGAATDAAVVGLGAYVIVTVKSLIVNTTSAAVKP